VATRLGQRASTCWSRSSAFHTESDKTARSAGAESWSRNIRRGAAMKAAHRAMVCFWEWSMEGSLAVSLFVRHRKNRGEKRRDLGERRAAKKKVEGSGRF